MFEELQVIELTHDIKEYNLKEGERGTIVEVYKNGKAYEVEFVTPNGKTIALLTLIPDDMRAYMNKVEYVSRLLNAPISLGTVSSMTLDTLINNDALGITTETFKSKADKVEFRYPIAAL